MKKLFIVLALVALTANSLCYADKNWFDVEVAKIRNIKEAKCDIINKELADISTATAKLQIDNTMSPAEKQQMLNAYSKKISDLNNEKLKIEEQYKADKDTLKTRWKNGTETSNDILAKWVYDAPVTRIQPTEYYTKTVVTESQPATTVTTRTRNKFGEEPISNIVPKTTTKQYVEKPVTTTTTTTPYTEHTRTVTTTTTEVPSKYQHQSVQAVKQQPVQTTQTTTYYSQPAQTTTTTTQTTTYGPKTTVNEKKELYVAPYDRQIDPSNFKVILH